MFIIKRFQDEKIVKFVVSFLLCVLFLLTSLSVSADEEEPTTVLPPPAVATQSTENSTDSDNIIIEQQTEPASELATDFISLTDNFVSSDYQLITVILLFVLIFVLLLKFIL